MAPDRNDNGGNGPLDDLFGLLFRTFQTFRTDAMSSLSQGRREHGKEQRERRFQRCMDRLGPGQSICSTMLQLEEELDKLHAEAGEASMRKGDIIMLNRGDGPVLPRVTDAFAREMELFAREMERSIAQLPQIGRDADHATNSPRPSDGGGLMDLLTLLLGARDHSTMTWSRELLNPSYCAGRASSSQPPYAPCMLERDPMLANAGICWRDAFEDLLRADQGRPLLSDKELGQSYKSPYSVWAQRLWYSLQVPRNPDQHPLDVSAQRLRRSASAPKPVPLKEESDDEIDYEYGHDNEDEHDESPTSEESGTRSAESGPKTELEAYERLLSFTSGTSNESENSNRPSVLSTLTTTERTVEPDGTVTTKIVLKKRFSDGNEETSSSVHTQRAGDKDSSAADPWKALMQSQSRSEAGMTERGENQNETRKKSGWFWSN